MSIKYGGVYLPVPTAELIAALAVLRLEDAHFFQTTSPRGKWNRPGKSPEETFKIGHLYWPTGAARFAHIHLLCSHSQLGEIRRQAYSANHGHYQALPFVMSDESSVDNKVEADLFMLPPKPLAQALGQDNIGEPLWLLTLADERYFWWERAAEIAITGGTTTWATLLSTIATALGITITTDTISSAYLKPSDSLESSYEFLPLLLDAVCSNIGQRFIRHPDGTCVTQNPLTAKEAQDAQLLAFRRRAGGLYAFKRTETNDLNGLVPATFLLRFPMTDGDSYTKSVTLASLALAEFNGVHAHEGTHFVRDTCAAAFTSPADATPSNEAELVALTAQQATDWYRWRLGRMGIAYAGVVPYEIEGLSDFVEWTPLSTRVERPPLTDLSENYNRHGTAGSIDDDDTPESVVVKGAVRFVCRAMYDYVNSNGVITTNYLPNFTVCDDIDIEEGDDFLFIRTGTLTDAAFGLTAIGDKSGHIDNGTWTVTDSGEEVGSASSTPLAIGSGSKTFTTTAAEGYVAGKPVRTTATAGTSGWMEGTVTSYIGTTLIISVTSTAGSGTGTAWSIISALSTPVFTRRGDFDQDGEFNPGTTVKVVEGNNFSNTAFKVCRSDDDPNEWDTAAPHINVKEIWFTKCEQQIYSRSAAQHQEDNYVQRWQDSHTTSIGSLTDDTLIAGMEAALYVSYGTLAANYDDATTLTKVYNTVTPSGAGQELKSLGLPYSPTLDGESVPCNQFVIFWNIGTDAFTVKNNAATTAAGGILTYTGADYSCAAKTANIGIYDTVASRWRVTSLSSSGNFTDITVTGGTVTSSSETWNITGDTWNYTTTNVNVNSGTWTFGASSVLVFAGSVTYSGTVLFPSPIFVGGVPLKSCLLNALKCPVHVTVATLGAAYARAGNVITANANGALGTQDGVTMSVDWSVLLRSDNSDAGIYTVTSLGSAGTKFTLTRRDDMNTSAMCAEGMLVEVRRGDTYKESIWCLLTDVEDGAFVLNTTAFSFCLMAQCGYFGGTVAITGGTITGVTSVGLIPPYLPGGYHQISGTARYYYLGTNYVANLPTTTIPLADDTLIAIPFIAQRSGTIAELKFKVASSGTGNLRCAFYLNSTTANNQYPGALVGVDLGAKTLSGTGVVTYTGLSVPIVEGNLYWLRINADVTVGTPTLSAFTASQAWAILGTTGVFEQDFNFILDTETYVTAPDPFTAGKAKASGPFPAFCVSYSS